jgi:outer membrane protein assembly factor BamB
MIPLILAALIGCQGDTLGPKGPGSVEVAGPFDADALKHLGLKVYWTFPLTLDPGERVETLYRLDEKLYCLTNDNTLIAVDAMRGVPTWRHNVADPGKKVYPPTHADGVSLTDRLVGIEGIIDPNSIEATKPFDAVMLNTLTSVIVLDRTTGRMVRAPKQIPFKSAANTAGATDGQSFFFGDATGRIVDIRLASGVAAWEIATDTILTAPPVYYANHVFFAGEDARFIAVQLGGAAKVSWTQTATGPITAAFYAGKKGCYVASEDMKIYAYDPFAGHELWDQPFHTAGPCRQPIQVAEESLFQYADDDRLYAVNLFTGEKRWDMAEGRRVLAVMAGKAYVLDDSNTLRIVDEMTGEPVGALPMVDAGVMLSNTTAPAIFGVTKDGELFCLRTLDAPRLTADDLRSVPRPR